LIAYGKRIERKKEEVIFMKGIENNISSEDLRTDDRRPLLKQIPV